MRKPRRTFTKNCIVCGKEMLVKSNAALRCAECQKEHARQYTQNHRDRVKVENERKNRPRIRMSIREVIKAMEKYNRENHTHHTYGQFVALMESGKI